MQLFADGILKPYSLMFGILTVGVFVYIVTEQTGIWIKLLVGLLMIAAILLIYVIWKNDYSTSLRKVHSLQEKHSSNHQSNSLTAFEEQARKILMTHRMKEARQPCLNFNSHCHSSPQLQPNPPKIKPLNDESIINPAHFIIADARKLIQENFSIIPTSNQEKQENELLTKLGLDVQKKEAALTVVRNFMEGALDDLLNGLERKINTTNTLLIQTFGLCLTHPLRADEHSISIIELDDIVKVYRRCGLLPNKYRGFVKSDQLHKIMSQLSASVEDLIVLNPFPPQNIPINLTLAILNHNFKQQQISVQDRTASSKAIKHEHRITIHINYKICHMSYPEFRTDQCLLFALQFMLIVVKKQFHATMPLLRSLSQYCK